MPRTLDVLLVSLLLFAGALTVVADEAQLDDDQMSLVQSGAEVHHAAVRAAALQRRASSTPSASTSPGKPSLSFVCQKIYFWDSYLLLCIILVDAVGIPLAWMILSMYCVQDATRKLPGVKSVWFACFGAILLLMSAVFIGLLVTCRFGRSGHLEFVHIPKNAGSTVETAGLRGDIMWSRFSFSLVGKRPMPDGNWCNKYHIPPWMLDRSPYHGTTQFCVTRHPYDRAVSEYTYLLSDLSVWSHKFADEYNTGLYDRTPCTARGLNHFIRRTCNLYKSGQMYIDDCHHVPQSQFIWDYSSGKPGKQICTEVLHVDKLNDEFDSLMIKYGYQVRLPVRPKYVSGVTCNVSTADLDEESRALLRELYADDFRLLNYSAY